MMHMNDGHSSPSWQSLDTDSLTLPTFKVTVDMHRVIQHSISQLVQTRGAEDSRKG